MPDTWFISDHHFLHANIIKFKDAHGFRLRPDFDTVEQMNECMVDLHNQTVRDNDIVWFLGDVVWRADGEAQRILSSLKGKLNLTVGNHDPVKAIAHHFERIALWWNFDTQGTKFRASHVPLHGEDLDRVDYSVHGHMHEKVMLNDKGETDPRYLSVCVEQIGYAPIHLDEVVDLMKSVSIK